MKRTIYPVFLLFLTVIVILSCKKQDETELKINSLIKQMTLDEKLDFIGGYNGFYIRGIERLGIPEIRMSDGPLGIRNVETATAFPASIGMAASFDKHLAYMSGKAIATEAIANNIHIILGPAMNIYRAPFCGRNFEYLGEDPYLAAQMATQFTLGMQKEGVMATAKHFAANNQEFGRHNVSSDMDERTLHEIYLPAFKATVQQGNVASVMTSYNLINGIHASQNDYLNNQVLKNNWGFQGFVMSDWVSTYDGVACAKGGLDLEMPFGKFMNPDTLRVAINKGLLSESIIDDKIRRILRMYFRFGLFDHPDLSKGYTLDSEFVRNIALESAREGMVLLKNENGFLPLQKENIKTIGVIGPNGSPAVTGGGGSSLVSPNHPLSLVEALQQVAGTNVKVSFAKGVETLEHLPKGFFDAPNYYIKKDGEKVPGVEADFYDNSKLTGDVALNKSFGNLNLVTNNLVIEGLSENNLSARFKCYYQPEKSGEYTFGVSGDDGYRLFINGEKVIDMWQNQGEIARHCHYNLKAGQEYKIEVEYYQDGGDAVIRFGVAQRLIKRLNPEDYKKEAVALAKQCDIVVFSVGFNFETETEEFDRSFDLPYNQSELIQAVAEVNPNCVVVLNAGGNVDMAPWIDQVKGLLHAWYPGQEGNLAASEILFGITNPSGKLPASFEKKWEDNPTFNSYLDDDNDLKVYYSEGIFLGYRHYDKSDVKPRFPFGFGLSYTTFEYNNMKLDKASMTSNETLKVSVNVKNTGNYDGAEALQVYVADKESTLPRPIKELKAFDRVSLKKGETKTITFELDKNAFAYYNPDQHDWVVEPGAFDILIGSSSVDIRQTASISIK